MHWAPFETRESIILSQLEAPVPLGPPTSLLTPSILQLSITSIIFIKDV